MKTNKVEIFTAGCSLCDETVEEVGLTQVQGLMRTGCREGIPFYLRTLVLQVVNSPQ